MMLVTLPAWLFHEITVANMAAPSDDRSTRLRVWSLVAGLGLTAVAVAGGVALKDVDWFLLATSTVATVFLFVVFLFAGEPLGPSPRVLLEWERGKVGALRRYLGPGVLRAFSLLILLIVGSFSALAATSYLAVPDPDRALGALGVTVYFGAFLLFASGFAALARARSRGPTGPRVALVGALFLSGVGPWIAMAIAGWGETTERALLVAAPSPGYAIYAFGYIARSAPERELVAMAGGVSALGWALLGFGLYALAGASVRRRLAPAPVPVTPAPAAPTASP
jgi:hypothetical protein